MSDWLEDLKAGSVVVLVGRYGKCQYATVERLTPTQVVLAGVNRFRFRRRNGLLVGGGAWYCGHIEEPTPQNALAVKASEKCIRSEELSEKLRDFPYGSLTLEQLERIEAILCEPAPEGGTP